VVAPALRRLVAWLLLLSPLVGCGGESREPAAPEDPPSAAVADPPPAALTPEEREHLAALGYVDFADEPAAEGDGVVRLDPARAAPGYSLYSIRYRCRAELVALDGTLVAAWEHRPCGYWSTAELLPSGDLLVTGQDPVEGDGEGLDAMYLLRLAWDGSVVWKAPIPAHHDAEITPSGDVLTVVAHYRRVPAVYPDAWVKDELLTLLGPDGAVREQRSILAMLQDTPDLLRIRKVGVQERHGRREVELFHANSVEWMHRPELAAKSPIYGLRNVLTCLRNQDAIAVFDWDARRLVWAWGRDELEFPHHPTVLDDGHVLVFDNGFRTGRSRVLEVDPLTDEIVWQYEGDADAPFFSKNRGSNQRLPNGNTLIADSDSGRAIEVTPEGEIVWELLAPYRNAEGHRATIERIHRHRPEAIAPLLPQPGLAP
jgi:hypothetical protein